MSERFIAKRRAARDGSYWWCVWDNKYNQWSNIVMFGKYSRKKDCGYAIKYYKDN